MNVDATTTPDEPAVDQEAVEPGHTGLDHDSGLKTEHHEEEAEHLTDNRYITIALILAVITAAEVAASYLDLGPVFIPMLLILMAIKFFTVAGYFMHLRFDNRIFTWLFYAGLFLAVGVYVAALLTFKYFQA
jgi:cytochrome c oxidase subunit 4